MEIRLDAKDAVQRSGAGARSVSCRRLFAVWIGGSMKAMTMAEIKDAADMAETWPGSGVLDWGEIGWETLEAWVALSVEIGGDAGLPKCDVESVKGCFDRWWRTANATGERTLPAGEKL